MNIISLTSVHENQEINKDYSIKTTIYISTFIE